MKTICANLKFIYHQTISREVELEDSVDFIDIALDSIRATAKYYVCMIDGTISNTQCESARAEYMQACEMDELGERERRIYEEGYGAIHDAFRARQFMWQRPDWLGEVE